MGAECPDDRSARRSARGKRDARGERGARRDAERRRVVGRAACHRTTCREARSAQQASARRPGRAGPDAAGGRDSVERGVRVLVLGPHRRPHRHAGPGHRIDRVAAASAAVRNAGAAAGRCCTAIAGRDRGDGTRTRRARRAGASAIRDAGCDADARTDARRIGAATPARFRSADARGSTRCGPDEVASADPASVGCTAARSHQPGFAGSQRRDEPKHCARGPAGQPSTDGPGRAGHPAQPPARATASHRHGRVGVTPDPAGPTPPDPDRRQHDALRPLQPFRRGRLRERSADRGSGAEFHAHLGLGSGSVHGTLQGRARRRRDREQFGRSGR